MHIISICFALYLLGIIPDSLPIRFLKIAVIRSISKITGLDTYNLHNYRPISQLPVVFKITERVASHRSLINFQHS